MMVRVGRRPKNGRATQIMVFWNSTASGTWALRRRLSIGLASAVVVASVGLTAAPTALGQTQQPAASDRDFGDKGICAGRAEPRGTERFLRTELYFGSSKPDGSVVTAEQFQYFLDHEITPRFPDGLTLITGLGQFKGSSGTIQRERSMLLILLYPVESARASGQKIEDIRDAYEKAFKQESVLRADEPLPECVSF
jgi:hypothetical protein